MEGGGGRIDDPGTARLLFAGLARCLREIDVIGWYRGGRVAGAVLTELGHEEGRDAVRVVGQTVSTRLAECLPPALAGRLRVRVYRYPETGDAEWRAHSATLLAPSRPPLTRRVALAIRGWVNGVVGAVAVPVPLPSVARAGSTRAESTLPTSGGTEC